MRILVLTDIHKSYDAARGAFSLEKPDLILDCGDHDDIVNLSELTPHFYINGNHEPTKIEIKSNDFPLPVKISPGMIIRFTDGKDSIHFTGIDGNYGDRNRSYNINGDTVSFLKNIQSYSLDFLLLHESPLNVKCNNRFAGEVLDQVNRLKPKIVFAGHTGIFDDSYTEEGIRIITLDEMSRGYGVVDITNSSLNFKRKKAVYSQG